MPERAERAGHRELMQGAPASAPLEKFYEDERAEEAAFAGVEEMAGGRPALVEKLAHLPLDARRERMLGALADPRNDTVPAAALFREYGVGFAQLVAMFTKAGAVASNLKVMERVWKHAPDVAEDVMLRALPHRLPCETCGGEGKFTKTLLAVKDGKTVKEVAEEPCALCHGKGEVLKQPKREQQELALKLAGAIAPAGAGAVNVNVNQKTAVGVAVGETGAMAGVFASFCEQSDEAMFGARVAPPEAIEAEAEVVAPGEVQPETELDGVSLDELEEWEDAPETEGEP